MERDRLRATARTIRRGTPGDVTAAEGYELGTAYLAEHPDDEDEPVTPERLVRIGFVPAVMKRYTLELGGVYASPPCGDLGWWWAIGINSLTFRPLPTPATLGDVRRLLVALGVEAKKTA